MIPTAIGHDGRKWNLGFNLYAEACPEVKLQSVIEHSDSLQPASEHERIRLGENRALSADVLLKLIRAELKKIIFRICSFIRAVLILSCCSAVLTFLFCSSVFDMFFSSSLNAEIRPSPEPIL